MPQSKLVALVFETWEDADRVMEGLTPKQAGENFRGGSSFAWTAGHIANTLDFWVNIRFAGHKPHPLISQSRFRFGGGGEADDWEAIRCGSTEVRSLTRTFIEGMSDIDLERSKPYQGDLKELVGKDISLRYYLSRVIVHHYFHIGEIASKRTMLGHNVGDYPGRLAEVI